MFEIENLKAYPKNGKHQYVATPFPLYITKGEDTFYWNNFTECNKPNYWVVYPKTDWCNFIEKDFRIKQFSNVNKAVKYACKEYARLLKIELATLKFFKEDYKDVLQNE